MFDAVLLMGGQGLRSGLQYNKVFYKINDVPIYQYALNSFLAIPECAAIILVIRGEDYALLSHQENPRIKIAYAGNKRQDSVYNGVLMASEEYILVHDAARPNIKQEDILNIYQATLQYKLAFLGVGVSDTIHLCGEGFGLRTLNREELWAAQTPQGFLKSAYLDSSKEAKKENYYTSDDVALIQKYTTYQPKLVEGSIHNIKITNTQDLIIMERLMKEGKK